jgi:hypothetical protein
VASRQIVPDIASVMNPSTPPATSMRQYPRPLEFVSFGTSSTTTPVLRARSPGSPREPTPHCRPIAKPQSLASYRPMSGIVTTAISPPDFARTSSMMRVIASSLSAESTAAKSLTKPVGAGG